MFTCSSARQIFISSRRNCDSKFNRKFCENVTVSIAAGEFYKLTIVTIKLCKLELKTVL